jgi:translation initiation factor 4G
MIEEMERAEKEEEERERKFAEEKKKKKEAEKAREAELAKEADERMKKAEREAEEREAAKEAETPEQKAEREKANSEAFASLKKNTMFGPAATQTETEPEEAPAPPAEPTATPPTQAKSAAAGKPKPAHLKLETTKAIEPPAPTPGMMSLKSARFLQVQSELVKYPEGILSPNPALNVGTKSKGKVYEPSFLLQFQDVFKEKPSVDWDMKLKETVGDSSESAGPKSARGAPSGMGGRQPSRSGLGGPMGSFTGSSFPTGRTLPPGTTSAQRFEAAQGGGGGGRSMTNPLAQLVGPPRAGGGFPVQMARTGSFQNMNMAPNSPRVGSSRGRGSRRGDNKPANRKEEAAMPLTAGMDLKPLEKSQTGWTPHSKTQQAAAQLAAGHLAPDMVQRKVKAALNKLTPEKFDKISDQILEIAGQSKNEDDGRTLRQVIQLTFEKACDEQHWSSMYAKFCNKMLNTMDPAIRDENVKDKHGAPVVGGALFRKYLLNRCQEEFEKGWEVNLPTKPDGDKQEEVMLSEEYYIAAAAKRKGLGLIQFIGELYKLNMLTLRIMHECVLKLLDFEGLPDESAIESLVKLLRTVGATMSTADAGPKMLSVYFERVEKIMNMEALPSRLRFMLLDLVDLRKMNWRDKQADKGPKTIQQIHAEAAAAQQAAAQSSANNRGRIPQGRGDARSFSGGGIPPPQDFGSRVAMDDLRKLTKGSSGRNSSGIGPSMLAGRTGSGRRGLGPGGAFGAGADSGASSRTATPPVQKEKESTSHANSFRYVF